MNPKIKEKLLPGGKMTEKKCYATLYNHYGEAITHTAVWTEESEQRMMKEFHINIRKEMKNILLQQIERAFVEQCGHCPVCDQFTIKWEWLYGEPGWKCTNCKTIYQDKLKERFTEVKFEDLPIVIEYE